MSDEDPVMGNGFSEDLDSPVDSAAGEDIALFASCNTLVLPEMPPVALRARAPSISDDYHTPKGRYTRTQLDDFSSAWD